MHLHDFRIILNERNIIYDISNDLDQDLERITKPKHKLKDQFPAELELGGHELNIGDNCDISRKSLF